MKPKCYFGTYLLNSNIILTFIKSLTHGKYKLLISQKNISFTKFYGNYVYYFHNQLTIKPMNITHDKTTHLVGLTKPKQAYLQSPARSGQPTHKSQQLENMWIGQLNFSNNWTAGAPSHQVPTCLIRSENRHVSTRGWILSPQAEIPSFLKWHKAKGHVTESWESFSQLSLLSPSTHSVKNPKLPWLGQRSS